MPRKTKIEPVKTTDETGATPAQKTSSATDKPKRKRSVPKKKTVAASETSASARVPASPAAAEPTDEEVRLRAYFLAERRLRLSLPGDSNHDWIEARRQLIAESGRASSSS